MVDLSECSFIDSAGLRSVLHADHALSELGLRLAVVTDQVQTKRLLSLTDIDQRLAVFKALDEAFAWFAADGAKVPDVTGPSTTASADGGPPPTSALP
jgi:hypothetical protein